MSTQKTKPFSRLAAMLRRDNGNATIEFALLFPVFLSLLLMVLETGFLLTRGVMLDRAVDMSMRELRLGTLTPMSYEGLKSSICSKSVIIQNCGESLRIELRPISRETWEPLDDDVQCIIRSEEVKPVTFDTGVTNELMLVRVCAIFDPFFPSSKLAAQVEYGDTGTYALVSMSAYVNEP